MASRTDRKCLKQFGTEFVPKNAPLFETSDLSGWNVSSWPTHPKTHSLQTTIFVMLMKILKVKILKSWFSGAWLAAHIFRALQYWVRVGLQMFPLFIAETVRLYHETTPSAVK